MNRFITFPSYDSDCLDFKCAVAQNDAFYLYFCHSFCFRFSFYLEVVKWRFLTMVTRNHSKNSPFKGQQFLL